MSQEKKLIIFLLSIFMLGSAYLFFVSRKYQNPGYEKNWWVTYFEDTRSSNMDFVIENYSDQTDFHWEALEKKKKIQEETVRISRGEKGLVSLKNFDPGEKEKITVTVSAGGETKEIYKYQSQ